MEGEESEEGRARCSTQRAAVREKPARREDAGTGTMSSVWKQISSHVLLILVSCRHINTKTNGPTAPPLDPISPPQNLEKSYVLKGERHTERVELLNPVSLLLRCTWTGDENKPSNISGSWEKDGTMVENSRVTVQLENQQYNLQRRFEILREENLGNYSCVFENKTKIEFILAAPRIGEVRDKPIVSYVGDSVVITCKMDDNKPKPKTWNWFRANGTDKEQISSEEHHKYEIKTEDGKTKLMVHNLTQDDSGLYFCGAVYNISTSMGHVELKVISFFEPLKPFIAILAEVIVLVAAILIYEKTQSKKDYTAAAGNGVSDQMNTQSPDENNQSEESSSMRQRKV